MTAELDSEPLCLACSDTGSNRPTQNQPEPCWRCGGNPRKALRDAFFAAMGDWKGGGDSVDAIMDRHGLALRAPIAKASDREAAGEATRREATR